MDRGAENADATPLPLPRRTLRKGTRSCIECKRRKIRCFFDTPSNSPCVPCRRRGVSCLGQEFFDEAVSHDFGVVERLERVEELLEKIIERGLPDSGEFQGDRNASTAPADPSRRPVEGDLHEDEGHEERGNNATTAIGTRRQGVSTTNALGTQARSSSQMLSRECAASLPVDGRFKDICQILHEALPSQEDSSFLFETGRSSIFLQAICNPYNELFNERAFRPASALAILPDVASHPIILARKLLQLALCVQQLDPSVDTSVLHLAPTPQDAMTRYVDLASSLVTCHDKFIDSIEGLECLCLEAVYLINSGNLRRSWLSWRRAGTMAQLMGLHRKTPPKTLKQLDPASCISFSVTWAHIVYSERYISLLLNLPTSITGNGFVSEEKMATDHPLERLDKVQSVICGRIIERNQNGDFHDFAITQQIDHDLQRLTNRLPATFWAPSLNITQDMDSNSIMFRVISAQSCIIHYNLLNVLHLPYLLRNASERQFDHSKMMCTYASREVLNRWINFRSIVRVVFCCRWVDFCALTAALALLLAHIDSHRNGFGDMLAHQRISDRMLIENAMKTMDELNNLNHDELSLQTALLTRKLLQIEADTAITGITYSNSVADGEHDFERGDKVQSFQLKIPYFGTVIVAQDGAPTTEAMSSSNPEGKSGAPGTAYTPASSSDSQPSITSAFNAMANSGHAVSSLGQPWTWQRQVLPGNEQIPYQTNPLITLQDSEQYQFDVTMMPELIAGPEEWAFQGVDALFFDSVITGYTAGLAECESDWSNWNISN